MEMLLNHVPGMHIMSSCFTTRFESEIPQSSVLDILLILHEGSKVVGD